MIPKAVDVVEVANAVVAVAVVIVAVVVLIEKYLYIPNNSKGPTTAKVMRSIAFCVK